MTDAQIITAIADIADNTPNTALEIRTLFTELFNRGDKTGTIKIKDCSNAYITANFDGTGLGINEELGYAICNGNNGTRNWDDRLLLAYGASNTTMGATKGANTVTLSATNIPPLNIQFTGSNDDNGDNGSFLITSPSESNGTKTLTTIGTNSTPFSIENKSIVTLVTMKL